jgi:hypothetical protein
MPSGPCKGCGYITNSTTSNWWLTKDLKPNKCYVRWINNKPEKGCGYNELEEGDFSKIFADSILKKR